MDFSGPPAGPSSSGVKALKSRMPTKASAASRMRAHVERILHPPHVRLRERRPPPGDLIHIAARHRVVARVKTVRHDDRRQDVDVARQLVVDAAPERVGRQARAHVEMRHLRQRVNARVGPARSVQLEVLPAGHGPDRAIDLALDRPGVLLNLPAAVSGAGVLDGQLESRHEGHAPRDGRSRGGRRTISRSGDLKLVAKRKSLY